MPALAALIFLASFTVLGIILRRIDTQAQTGTDGPEEIHHLIVV